MPDAAAYCAMLPLEVAGLFATWNWSRRARTVLWLVLGFGAAIVASMLAVFVSRGGTTPWMILTGVYLGSGLAWAWWIEGLAPSRWRCGEWLIACLSVAALGRGPLGS